MEKTQAQMGAERVQAEFGSRATRGRLRSRQTPVPSELSELIDAAIQEARASGAANVAAEHLILAILARGAGSGFQVLQEASLTPALVRERIKELTTPPA
jgi:ATP-dependent Clp protease ATP-binding subunit ClpA